MSVETTASRFDSVKWVIVLVLVAVAVVGNSYYADQSLLYRVLGILAIAFGCWVGRLADGQRRSLSGRLVKGSRTEIRKVVWPTRQETVQTTMIVVVICVAGGAAAVGARFAPWLAGVPGNCLINEIRVSRWQCAGTSFTPIQGMRRRSLPP